MADGKTKRVFVSVNDPSADVHCAGLIAALKKAGVEAEFVGIGGPKMAAAGCEVIESTVGRAVMTYTAIAHVGHFYRLVRRVRRYLQEHPVDLMIVCDSPSFNFHVAKAAKQAGVKTLFYVAPQLWAWGGWRIRKLRRLCDKLCCLLPFEEAWFGERGVDASFVGNPLLDGLPSDLTGFRKDYSRFDPNRARIALMPGSRLAEIASLWKPMQEIAVRLKQKYRDASFVVVAASDERRQLLEQTQIPGFVCEYSVDTVRRTAAQVDFSIVASGSATLEVGSCGCPMVILYQTNRFLWHLIGRWLVYAKFFTLVNLLADREVVPEFMPYFTSIEPILQRVDATLQDRTELTRISNELIDVVEPLTRRKASEETARIVVEMLR
ncbi:MAG TPA: lipid-A-disaccharide synthase [Sedimentisphaerales bacterium]|jgi:lipid-A-disaccharide synthase|nr:lipid-A-disaccharide synthase [Sedimentisphaerales bacterium]HNU30281.1 lipid-A-disaccharide synthase [Sedimentisphaerales bacterium]